MKKFQGVGKATLAVLGVFGWLAVGAYAQNTAPAASDSSLITPPGNQSGATGGSDIGEPPTPVSTLPLPYPRLTGPWAQGPLTPSLSERFNEALPAWLRFTGELRERFEGYTGGSFKANTSNDYDLQRIRLGMRITPTSWIRFYVEAQDARVFGMSPALPPYQKDADLFQAYVELGSQEGDGFSVKVGRQQLSFGNNRFLGDSWWTNVSRTFDGVRAAYQQGRFRVDAFAASVVIVRDGVIDHHLEGNNLYGVYATAHDVIPHATLDVYQFWNLRPSFALEGLKSGHLDEWTSGFRWVGALPLNFDYRTEMAYQWGELGVDKVRAWSGHWVAGYTFKRSRFRPRTFIEYDYASGSKNDKDGFDNTFDPLYPSTHDKLGLADQFGWRNIQDYRVGQEFTLTRKWKLGTAGHDFFLANAHDALYPTRGSFIVDDAKGTAGTHVGEEWDIQTVYTPTRQTQVDVGLGRVFPGPFLKQLTQGRDFTYPYMMIEYVF
jgi:Alginate export